MENIPRVGLGVLIFNHSGQILLGKRKRGHGVSSWGPPGGHLEFGESFENCAIREVLEETGLEIVSPRFVAVTNDFFEVENKHYISVFMKAEYPVKQEIENREPDKTEMWMWFSTGDLPQNVFLPLKALMSKKSYGSGNNFLI